MFIFFFVRSDRLKLKTFPFSYYLLGLALDIFIFALPAYIVGTAIYFALLRLVGQ